MTQWCLSTCHVVLRSAQGHARGALLATVGVAVSVAVVAAASPVFWRVSTQAEFLRGEVDALSVDADGHLVLGPVTSELFDTTAPVAWSLAPAEDDRLWVGTGSDARLYLVDAAGSGREVYDAESLDIHAVAPAGDGAVYVATSPDGLIERVTADGQVTPVFDPEGTYIWGLAVDEDGTLYAATGEPARIYRIAPSGASETLFESDATHVLSLALEPDGAVLAGTESPGQVLRIDQTGRGFVLLDSAYDEVRSLRAASDGSVLAVAVSGGGASAASTTSQSAPSTGSATATATVSVTTTVSGVGSSSTAASSSPPAATNGGGGGNGRSGAVYRIGSDGLWEILWRSDTDVPYDAVLDDGRLVVGTGPDGKIYEVAGEPPHTVLLGRAPAQQVTRFAAADDGTLRYTTANPGKVVSLSDTRAERGVYESEVRDAGTVARWGTLRWRGTTPGGSRIELATRSGNTSVPNDTWSEWSSAYADGGGSQIVSPNARYLQWRASLVGGDASPVLTSVTAAYLPRNLRPVVTSVTVHAPGAVFQQPFPGGDPPIAGLARDRTAAETPDTTATLGRQGYRKGIQTVVWEASDDNDDELEYSVAYRREGADGWETLASGLSAAVFAWDTSAVPDGAYSVQVAVSDAPDNAPETALVGQRESPVFDIDNSAPVISITSLETDGTRMALQFTVEDQHSPIREVEISSEAEEWRTVYPVDGIPDGLLERFEITLDDTGGPIIIRATDALRNAATASGR